MRLVATRRFEVGAALARDIPAAAGAAPLLRTGVELTDRHREALLGTGVNAVYVDDDLGRDIEVMRAISDRTRDEARGSLGRALADVPSLAARGEAISDKRTSELMDVTRLIASEVASVGDAALALSDLAAADNYLMEHTIDVTVTGMLVARHMWETKGRVDWRGERTWNGFQEHLTQLGIGLMLHDIGKLAVPAPILHKTGPLDQEEWQLMKQHPTIGLDMVRSDAIWPRAKDVIRSHHERWSGSGYPRALVGDDIQPFARIAAVADVFDAVTSERPHASARPQHVGVSTIREGAGTDFAPEVADAFCEIIPPHPPGSEIVLADGSAAVVLSVPPGFPDLPRVRIHRDCGGNAVQPRELDLTEHPELAPSAVAVAA